MRAIAVAVILSCLFLANCGDPNSGAKHYSLGDSESLLTSGATRFVTERPRAMPGDGVMPTLCTEPDPDVAIAFARSASISANISNPGGVSGQGSGSFSSSETATALAGRTAGVLALRDGLYAACQTYVNGIIGHDAYALILSQYGNLLVALNGTGTINQVTFTAQDAAASAMLVSCISEYDPTRLGAWRTDRLKATNPLLTPAFCSSLMRRIAQGGMTSAAAAKAAVKKTKNSGTTTADSSKAGSATPPTAAPAKKPATGATDTPKDQANPAAK